MESRAYERSAEKLATSLPGVGAPVLTTESSMDKKMEGKKAGATGWIVKPFNPAQLLATLARVL